MKRILYFLLVYFRVSLFSPIFKFCLKARRLIYFGPVYATVYNPSFIFGFEIFSSVIQLIIIVLYGGGAASISDGIFFVLRNSVNYHCIYFFVYFG